MANVSSTFSEHVVYAAAAVQLCLTLHSTPGFPDLHYLLAFAQTHVHCVVFPTLGRKNLCGNASKF